MPASKYSIPAEQAVAALAAVSSAPLVATRNLYLQFVLAWLTGNGDLHAKNISVLRSSAGAWAIAPRRSTVRFVNFGCGATSSRLRVDP